MTEQTVTTLVMLKFRDLCLNYTKCEEATIDWLKGNGALRTSANCSKCGTSCNFVARKGTYCWRCPRYGCQSVISMREGSFFTGSHLKLHEIVEISYWWASETSVSKTIQQTGHSPRTIVVSLGPSWFGKIFTGHLYIIQQFVMQGTTVISDEWRYGGVVLKNSNSGYEPPDCQSFYQLCGPNNRCTHSNNRKHMVPSQGNDEGKGDEHK